MKMGLIVQKFGGTSVAGGMTSCPFLSSYSMKLLGCTMHIRPFCVPKSIRIGYLYSGR